MLVNNEFRTKPPAVPRRMPLWQQQLHNVERERVKTAERAMSREQKQAEALARFTPLVKAAGADLRALVQLGRQTHGIDVRWGKTLHERCQKAVVELVRLIDQDTDDLLPPIGDSVVRGAVERLLGERARISEEMLKN